MGWLAPGEDALDTILEDEDNADSNRVRQTCSRRSGPAHLALKRRKLFVINGSEKPGRLMYFELLTSCGRSRSSTSLSGKTCCRSLRFVHLALHCLKESLALLMLTL